MYRRYRDDDKHVDRKGVRACLSELTSPDGGLGYGAMRFLWFAGLLVLSPALLNCADGAATPTRDPSDIAAPSAISSAQLVERARAVTAPAWREAARASLSRAVGPSGAAFSPVQIEAQIDHLQRKALLEILAMMEATGGPEVIAYCLTLGEYEPAPVVLRKAALSVLARHIDRNDLAARERAAAIWNRVATLEGPSSIPSSSPAPSAPRPASDPLAGATSGLAGSSSIGGATLQGGSVSNASQVVAGMAPGFRRCYNRALQEDTKAQGSIRVTAKIDASGAVASLSETHQGLSPATVSCLLAVVSPATFAPPSGGGATIVIPVNFSQR
ncbi:Hypothetical protein A7982_06172 [Minicystis rosea]|nr:Hypothetical protein A7982_06172 [Minicystis rosea]